MLRAQAFENLFTLLPILLVAVISIVLRIRASQKRKQREEQAGERPAGVRQPGGGVSSFGERSTGERPTGVRSPGVRPPGVRPPGERPTGEPGPRAPWMPPSSAARPSQPASTAAPDTTFRPQRPPRPQIRESYAYPPPLTLNELKQSPAEPTPGQPPVIPRGELREPKSFVSGISYGAAVSKPAGPRTRTADSLAKLPPLKRAVIWAEILGPPGGRQ